ncbi:MAG TPA: Na+/H+ antiporter subunit E [Devosiaceae bacterium]|jgi:multicomponent Na+:H+ antiporter subunit E|nr:Na+/H+ antiporter subunit E [Devosiaceae bacterium]
MSLALMAVLFSLGWAAATGSFTLPNLLFGGAVGVVALYLIRDRVEAPRLSRRLKRIFVLAVVFAYELVMSAVKVAVLVLRPDMRRTLTPGIIAFPLAVKSDAEITILANLVTLTPGTLSVDVSEDRQHLYIHVLDMKDREEVVRGIAEGFEHRVAEVFR